MITFMDVLAFLCIVLVVLYMMSLVVRWLNRWKP